LLPSGKKLPFAVMALTLCVAVVLGLGEIVIALTPLDRQLEANISARKQVERLSGAYRRPAFGLTPKKGAKQGNRIFTTNETFRASTVVMPKPKGAFRIFLLGDSVAWGMIGGVHMEPDDYNSFCLKRSLGHKLQKKVQAALPSRSVQLVNLGLPGCISEVVLERSKEVMQLDPDAFVINIGANEGNMEIVFSTLDPNRHKRSWLRRHFRLVDLLVTYSRPYEPPQEQPLLREKSLSENLIATLKLARNLGVPAYVCTPMSRKPDEFQSLVQVIRDVKQPWHRREWD
jgi:hypothetical protein